MTDIQLDALRLAEFQQKTIDLMLAEMQSLREVNAELVEALTDLVNEIGDGFMPHKLFVDQALAALAKSQGDNNG
jgi:hypothetical protein